MDNHLAHLRSRALLVLLSALLIILAACGGSTANPILKAMPAPAAADQTIILPDVGTQDITTLDPAQGLDANDALVIGMIYSGLVKSDKNLNVLPDQATWSISPDNKVYTFHLQSGITFSDGTPVTAQSYVYTLTRALLPEVESPIASFFEGPIVGAAAVSSGKTRVLAGVKATNSQTLRITLTHPTPYFLEMLTNPLYFPLNQQLIEQYGQANWTNYIVGNGAGTGPLIVKEWDHNIKMILVPNPYYHGARTRVKEVDMPFVADATTALNSYRAGQYSLDWNILPADMPSAEGSPGFSSIALLQTDILFFNNKMPPFDSLAVRQAFAYATDKTTLAHIVLNDTVIPAPTIIPPGMPGYQAIFSGIPYDKSMAKALLQLAYPDLSMLPPITFSYPSSQISSNEANALQAMWQTALGIQVKLHSVQPDAYYDETANRQIQFGFTQWTAQFPDPYDWLAVNLLSTAPNNTADWVNPTFDQTVVQAEMTPGDGRIALYNQAEQIAIQDVGWLPLDHQSLAAIIPSWVHGVTLNGEGFFFGDWSNVYLSPH